MEKQELRRHFLEQRALLSAEERFLASEQVARSTLSLPALAGAGVVFCYVSFGKELITHRLIETLISMGKTVCVPLCDTETGTMTAHVIQGLDELKKGSFGILEPENRGEISPAAIDCALVPGCVFGRNFHRIGFGKGYYDRFLAEARQAKKIGLCYHSSLIERVPHEETDISMDFIVTENEVLSL